MASPPRTVQGAAVFTTTREVAAAPGSCRGRWLRGVDRLGRWGLVSMEGAMRVDLNVPGSVPSPFRRVRAVGVGLALLGAVGLGLAAVPACAGGGGSGD